MYTRDVGINPHQKELKEKDKIIGALKADLSKKDHRREKNKKKKLLLLLFLYPNPLAHLLLQL